MLVKQAQRFLNRKKVRSMLENTILTNDCITRLNLLFSKHTCKSLENMHETIAKFVIYDLNNYEGRLRRLSKIPGTNVYTQLLRYGKKNFKKILQEQTDRKTAHFPNRLDYWMNNGYSLEEATSRVIMVQKERNRKSVEKVSGTNQYSCRSIGFWMAKGFDELQASKKVSEVCTTNGLVFYIKKYGEDLGRQRYTTRINQWLAALEKKSPQEKTLIRLKQSPTVEGNLARGLSLDEAMDKYEQHCRNMREKHTQSFSKISQELFLRLDDRLVGGTFFHMKNYEYNVGGYRVDFYHKPSQTIIEFYGDFFHRNPKIYGATVKAYGYTSQEKWCSDLLRERHLREHKSTSQLVVVWEWDYRNNPTLMIEKLLTLIGSEYVF